jgi:CxxC motif-containing protein (DUF1111 family)
MKTIPSSAIRHFFLVTTLTAATALAQEPGDSPAPRQRAKRHLHPHRAIQPPRGAPRFGDPLPQLTRDQFAAFTAGLEEFENVETPESGLGPIFNNTSCVACHSAPATGGGSAETVTRFGAMENGHFDPLTALGGSLLQAKAIDPAALEVIPQEATITTLRQSTPLFGAGLIEAIPDRAIQMNADRAKPDGIKGRVAMIRDITTDEMRVGRFGWKAQQATLLAFAADAYVNEMGITNRFFKEENSPNGNAALLAQFDKVADPEDEIDRATGKADIDKAADFMRFLAPPPQVRATQSAMAGGAVFMNLGCAQCHIPVMFTDRNPIRALNQKPVVLFSDLLLHDMGALGDGIEQGAATGNEFRTAPLWGLRASAPYLHDGRARTIEEAIRAHDGEALRSRDRFLHLRPLELRQLLDFLKSI